MQRCVLFKEGQVWNSFPPKPENFYKFISPNKEVYVSKDYNQSLVALLFYNFIDQNGKLIRCAYRNKPQPANTGSLIASAISKAFRFGCWNARQIAAKEFRMIIGRHTRLISPVLPHKLIENFELRFFILLISLTKRIMIFYQGYLPFNSLYDFWKTPEHGIIPKNFPRMRKPRKFVKRSFSRRSFPTVGLTFNWIPRITSKIRVCFEVRLSIPPLPSPEIIIQRSSHTHISMEQSYCQRFACHSLLTVKWN